jgi:hypothetical protein
MDGMLDNLTCFMECLYFFWLLEHLVDDMVDLYVLLLYKVICFISNCLSRIKISNYYISRNIYQQRFITGTAIDTPLSTMVLETLLITPNYQQRFKNHCGWQL